jgi:UPF0755 protein
MSDLDIGIPFNDAAPRSRNARHRRRRRNGSEGRRSTVAFLVMIVVFGLLAAGGWYGYDKVRNYFTAPDYAGKGTGSVTVVVEEGATASDIANVLFKAGVIKSAKAFTEAANKNPDALKLQPGTYSLHSHMSAGSALTLMLDPASKSVKSFLIKEGLTVKEILPLIAKQTGIALAEVTAAAADPTALGVPDWARTKDGKPLLEGFLFPAKYEIGAKDDAKAVLSRMVQKTVKVMEDDGFIAAGAAIGKTPVELLTIASLVQDEGKEVDFGKISRVVYNRLAEKSGALTFLQFDSTTQYWLIQSGQGRKAHVSKKELTDPRNTYSTALDKHAGLPPTPISNPGKAALDAAVHPEPGNWTYFVVTSPDGRSSFTADYNEQKRNVQKCKQIGVC